MYKQWVNTFICSVDRTIKMLIAHFMGCFHLFAFHKIKLLCIKICFRHFSTNPMNGQNSPCKYSDANDFTVSFENFDGADEAILNINNWKFKLTKTSTAQQKPITNSYWGLKTRQNKEQKTIRTEHSNELSRQMIFCDDYHPAWNLLNDFCMISHQF